MAKKKTTGSSFRIYISPFNNKKALQFLQSFYCMDI